MLVYKITQGARMAKKKQVDIDQLLNRSLHIIQAEIQKVEKKDFSNLLDPKSAATINDYIRTLLALKKEDRQAAIQDDIGKLSDKELTTLAQQALKFIGDDK